MDSRSIINAVKSVTNKWAKQRKKEERDTRALSRRLHAMTNTRSASIRALAKQATEEAYNLVTDNGRLICMVRQLMYSVRRLILRHTDEVMRDQYYIHDVLPEYIRERKPEWADNLITDERGHFREPHTGKEIGLGTLQVREYLAGQPEPTAIEFIPNMLYPTHGPKHRYSAILFVEKEGFRDLLDQAQIQERNDIAIMSTKGMHVVAARKLADEECGKHGIPLLVLRDFDKAGWSMIGTFRRDSDRYQYKHKFDVFDLGLRLSDVQEWELESERWPQKSALHKIRANLRENGANKDEIEFIADQSLRVELNSFTVQQMIEYVEAKLAEHKIKKVIPDADTLEDAYRRALTIQHIKRRFGELKREAEEYAEGAKVPKALRRKVTEQLKAEPAKPWDMVVADLAEESAKKDKS